MATPVAIQSAVEETLSNAFVRFTAQPQARGIAEDIKCLQAAAVAQLGAALEREADGCDDKPAVARRPLDVPRLSTEELEIVAQCVEPKLSAIVERFLSPSARFDPGSAASPSLARCKAIARQLQAESTRRVICIADLHGNLVQAKALWSALSDAIGPTQLATSTVVFLGDFCDRGPDTCGMLDFLNGIRRSHRGPVRFLAGNHDFGMSSFLDCLPIPPGGPPLDLDSTRNPDFTTGFWPHAVTGGMHYQGRRWAEGKVYDSSETFESYGVRFDASLPASARPQLLAAVPAEHRELLASLEWVADLAVGGGKQAVQWGPVERVVCVHAGLQCDRPFEAQLKALKSRDLASPLLHEEGDAGRISAFVGRDSVKPMHPDVDDGSTLLISGHHGVSFRRGGRIVLDQNGGRPDAAGTYPVEALVLPEMRVIAHDGSERSMAQDAPEEIGYNTKANRAARKARKAEAKAKAVEAAEREGSEAMVDGGAMITS